MALALLWFPGAALSMLARFEPSEPWTLADEIRSVGIYALEISLALLLLRRAGSWREVTGLGGARVGPELGWAVVLFVVWWVESMAIWMFRPWVLGEPTPPDTPFLTPGTGLEWTVITFVYLVSATAEETVFRAYFWTRLTQLTGRPVVAACVAAALFVTVHTYGAFGSLELFVFALTFHITFWLRRSLWPLILAHALYNMALVIADANANAGY